jgi:hypothetical protein
MKSRSFAVPLTLVLVMVAPLALAQKKKPKGGAKGAASASASASASAAPESAPSATPEPAPTETATTEGPKPAASASAGTETNEWDIHDVTEDPNKRYYFIGLRYRLDVIPKFMVNLFVDEGATFTSNTIGAEADFRKDNFSYVVGFSYVGYGTDDTLFHQKNRDNSDSNWSYVNSSLHALYLTLDSLWSIPIDTQQHWQFEYGFGVGIGFVFGDLQNNWVYSAANGPLVSSSGTHYAKCQTPQDNVACRQQSEGGTRQPTDTDKVGGFVEPNWFNGGSVPVVFPHIAFPQIGVRYKPIKQLETRFTMGFSLTGFFFGLSADYGLEQNPKKESSAKAKIGEAGYH